MPTFVLADFDFLLRDNDSRREKYNAKPHNSVQSLGPAYFEREFILGSRGADLFDRIVQARTQIKNQHEDLFYLAKSSAEIPIDLSQLLLDLRNSGVCILNTEIENLSLAPDFISGGQKINLSKVFEFNARLAAGQEVRSLFDTEQFEEFLQIVFAK